MKALNELHLALMKRREARALYKATRHLDPWIARDAGLHVDHLSRQSYPL